MHYFGFCVFGIRRKRPKNKTKLRRGFISENTVTLLLCYSNGERLTHEHYLYSSSLHLLGVGFVLIFPIDGWLRTSANSWKARTFPLNYAISRGFEQNFVVWYKPKTCRMFFHRYHNYTVPFQAQFFQTIYFWIWIFWIWIFLR